MSEITDLASKLAKAIAGSPQAAAMRAARTELDKHPEIDAALKDYQQQAEKIGQLESQQKPVEIDDKRRLQELRDKLVGFDAFKKFTAAQMEYVSLMHSVNETIRRNLADVEGAK